MKMSEENKAEEMESSLIFKEIKHKTRNREEEKISNKTPVRKTVDHIVASKTIEYEEDEK